MLNIKPIIQVLLLFSFFGTVLNVYAVDEIKLLKPLLGMDKRERHKDEVIFRALEITIPEFGPYLYKTIDVDMTPGRALISIRRGELINTYIAASSDIWDKSATAIKIPIRRGLMSYRLLLIHRANLDKFENVQTLEDLNMLTAGFQRDWAITGVFEKANMNMMTSHTFEGLFSMLEKRRFDYTPRAIYEAYDELNTRKDKLPNLMVEPHLALYIPLVTYVYVSKNAPRIAQRIEAGLKKMSANGDLDKLLDKYYEEDIKKADLANRKIIYFDK
ncbi:hypothetical protein [Paraglaciecola marina]|uniref:hypothetical protein n=1 Tax=Paraglaciecola marina TaxID=2500157 RepID=UPI00105E004D|nr:hypothetical protein [Paraglaciecola marina]